ncbi:hypothetical protein [Caballeronia sp. GACF4]|uniref:hypothetical protein n=1 Tax=Caballeronia sp. GACF4 TaxID=2921763 RepID=UPI00202857BA|nr:hypothetical protein [Caballeronia sp. GACF4]
MTDFADAFKRGQDAAAQAAAARAEINDVFKEINEQLSAATEGKLEIERQNFEKPKKKTVANLLGGIGMDFLERLEPAETEPWIAARNPRATNDNWVRLAKWYRPQEGYPCRLTYDKTDANCHDRTALAEALAEMLANASIGEQIRRLLNNPLKESQ